MLFFSYFNCSHADDFRVEHCHCVSRIQEESLTFEEKDECSTDCGMEVQEHLVTKELETPAQSCVPQAQLPGSPFS